jgi:hypothetical protein
MILSPHFALFLCQNRESWWNRKLTKNYQREEESAGGSSSSTVPKENNTIIMGFLFGVAGCSLQTIILHQSEITKDDL